MMTSTSQEILETTVGSSKRTSKGNPLAILFFIMGAPHIYGIMQRGSKQRQWRKADSDRFSLSAQSSNTNAILAANASRSFLGRYLAIGLVAVLAAAIMEILITSLKT